MNLAAALLMLALGNIQAGDINLPTDPRIRVMSYNPGQVITLPVAVGFAAVVELGPDERVDSVIVGNSAVWQVTASGRGDTIVVKPLSGATATDMVVVTAERRYVFLLQPAEGEGTPFVLRFVQPDRPPQAVASASPSAATFRFSGARTLIPAAMRDDGQRTTISWRHDASLPAVFAVEQDGREAIVNGRMVGDDYVLERIAAKFVFRRGNQHASATRRTARVR